jgi:hypothetical protein
MAWSAILTVDMLALLLSCSSPPTEKPLASDTGEGTTDWNTGLSNLEDGPRGWKDIRSIIHLHSPHSHDACDGEPQPDGVLDEGCLQDLREGLCTNRIDVAFLSDHPAHSEEAAEFSDLLLVRENDELLYNEDGQAVANWMQCGDGHRTLLLPGVESGRMMPLGLEKHLEQGYSNGAAGDFLAAREAGGVGWVAHTEQRDPTELAELGIEGMELYQLHANLDPDIREESLGLDPLGYLQDVQPFFFGEDGEDAPHPDLAPLAFLVPNEPSIQAFEHLGQTQRIGISAGTDAHQNVFPIDAHDGERIDSYRRMMRWFNTRLRIQADLSPETAKNALREASTWIAFEIFGTPEGLDLCLDGASGRTEIGGETPMEDGLVLHASLPTLSSKSPQGAEKPERQGRIYLADGEGRELIGSWDEGSIELPIERAGVYRMEVWITPKHLEPFLGAQRDLSTKEHPWIYTGGIFVRP